MAIVIIGISEAGVTALPEDVFNRVAAADLVIAAPRFHSQVPHGPEVLAWPSPFSDVYHVVEAASGKSIVVLVTGDPLWFGAGASLIAQFGVENCEIIPGVSGFQAAPSRMGWPISTCETLTVHGRPVSAITPYFYPRARLLILAQDNRSPESVAAALSEAGHGAARIEVLAHIGGGSEARFSGIAANWEHDDIPDFHIIAVECPGEVSHDGLMALPDEAFVNDGKLTKRDVRASALTKLAPFPGAVMWDIGAGSGAIAIDFLRNAPRGRAYAIDKNDKQIAGAESNAAANGVPSLCVIKASLPDGLDDLPQPDAVFIGGGLSEAVVTHCQASLRVGGCLVVHAVTLESEATLMKSWQQTGGHLTRLSVQHADPVGAFHGWRPLMPVTQWHWVKEA